LRQVGQAQIASQADTPAVGRLDAGGDPQQRGLAAAVHAYHTHTLASIDAERDPLQQWPIGELLTDRFKRENVHSAYCTRSSSDPGWLRTGYWRVV
jgi:hypothetical protein